MKKNLNNSIVVFRNLVIADVEKIVKKVYLSDTNTSSGVMTPFEFDNNDYRVKFDCGYYQGKMILLGTIKFEEKIGGRYREFATIKLSGIECDFDIASMVSNILTAMNEQYFDKVSVMADEINTMVEADVEDIVADIKDNSYSNDVLDVNIYKYYNNTMFTLYEKYGDITTCGIINLDIYMDIFVDTIKRNTDMVIDYVSANGVTIKCCNDTNVDDNMEVSYVENKYENPENNIGDLNIPLGLKEEAIDILDIFDSEWATTVEYQECWERMLNLVRRIAEEPVLNKDDCSNRQCYA